MDVKETSVCIVDDAGKAAIAVALQRSRRSWLAGDLC